jgi:hypothetical protein
MKRTYTTRVRWALLVSALVGATAVAAGSVVAGQFRTDDPAALEADVAHGDLARIADIPAVDGLPSRGVYVQVTDSGRFCLWDAPSATSPIRQGGCNSAEDPLGGSALSASLAYEGGPDIERVRDARIVGLAAPSVAQVAVLMSDGSERTVRLKRVDVGSSTFAAFGYRIRQSDLRHGIGPTAILGLGGGGAEIARQPTGIGE